MSNGNVRNEKETKQTVIEMKEGFHRLIKTLGAAKERINKLDYRSVEITLIETQREKVREKIM